MRKMYFAFLLGLLLFLADVYVALAEGYTATITVAGELVTLTISTDADGLVVESDTVPPITIGPVASTELDSDVVELTGTGIANSTLTISVEVNGEVTVDDVVVDADGTWRYELQAKESGEYTIVATGVNADGTRFVSDELILPISPPISIVTKTPTPTKTATKTPTRTSTSIPTSTFTPVFTDTPSPTSTGMATQTPTSTKAPTKTPTPIDTSTDVPTSIITSTFTDTPSPTSTDTATQSPTPSKTPTTNTFTPSPSSIATDRSPPTSTNTLIPFPVSMEIAPSVSTTCVIASIKSMGNGVVLLEGTGNPDGQVNIIIGVYSTGSVIVDNSGSWSANLHLGNAGVLQASCNSNLPTLSLDIMPTAIAVPVPHTTSPEAVTRATPTPTLSFATARVNKYSNIRVGPGTKFPATRKIAENSVVDVVGYTITKDNLGNEFIWYKLKDKEWIYGELLSNLSKEVPYLE